MIGSDTLDGDKRCDGQEKSFFVLKYPCSVRVSSVANCSELCAIELKERWIFLFVDFDGLDTLTGYPNAIAGHIGLLGIG